jgi:hypothetical protein
MAILDLQTENPDISWVIKKNPLTQKEVNQPFSRSLRQGEALAWYRSDNDFRILFKEGNGSSSFYKFLDNNYLNPSAYNCSYVYCALIAEMLSAPVKSEHEKDIVCLNTLSISAMLITLPAVAQFFIKYFADKVKIEMNLLGKKTYSVSFSGKVSLHYLTNLVQVFCLMQSIEDKNIYIDMSEGAINKYVQSLNRIEAPYFIVYLFLSRCVPDYESFKKIQPQLESRGWKLNFGNTQKQRFDSIKKYIQGGKKLQDIGCGELYYSRQFCTKYEKVDSWDVDEQIQERNARFLEKKSIFNIELKKGFGQEDLIAIENGDDILITEMLEHMPKDQAVKILQSLKDTPFRRLIITVPNGEFNQFYKLDGAFRHDDHYWEPTYLETVEFIENIFGVGNPNVEIKPIGDGINGIHVSTLIVIDKN